MTDSFESASFKSVRDALSKKDKLKVLLVGAGLPEDKPDLVKLSMEELKALSLTLGYEVVDSLIQNCRQIDPATYIGSGKVNGIKNRNEEFDLVIFNQEITPNQQRNLSKRIDREVMDRTGVILEIFARHARSKEAKNQVELARLNYILPRLGGMWTHLDRETGGGVTSRGMGEKQINIDRTIIRDKIAKLKKYLKKAETQEKIRRSSSKKLFSISLVGYTNAGKSSLMNRITDSDVLVEDKLFATLDSTSRLIRKSGFPEILLSDTVGFIREIPHGLIASFQTTLKSVVESDLLLHVADASDPFLEEKIASVDEVLREIGAEKIDRLMILNKIDKINSDVELLLIKKKYPSAIYVTSYDAKCGEVIGEHLLKYFAGLYKKVKLSISFQDKNAISFIHKNCFINRTEYTDEGILFDCLISDADYLKLGLISPEIADLENRNQDHTRQPK